MNYPPAAGAALRTVRRVVFEVARAEQVGPLRETLKWGEPAYLTEATGAGSTLRLSWSEKRPDSYALMLNCKTTLARRFRTRYGDAVLIEGDRAVLFDLDAPVPEPVLREVIADVLTYHRDKRLHAVLEGAVHG